MKERCNFISLKWLLVWCSLFVIALPEAVIAQLPPDPPAMDDPMDPPDDDLPDDDLPPDDLPEDDLPPDDLPEDDPCSIDPMSDECLNPSDDAGEPDPCEIDPMSDECLNPGSDPDSPPQDLPDTPDPDDFGDFGLDQISDLDPSNIEEFTDDHINNLDPDAASGFSIEQLDSLPADVFDQFTPDQIENLDPDALGALDASQLENLEPSALAGFTPEQIDNLSPDALGGLDPSQLGELEPDAFGSLDINQIEGLDPIALSGVNENQIDALDQDAVSGLSPEQFQSLPLDALGGFDEDNLGGLDPTVVQGLDLDDLNSLDPLAVQNLPGSDLPEFLTNLEDPSISPDDVSDYLPEGWQIDSANGDLTAPPGAELAFPLLDQPDNDGTTLPTLPDFSRDLSLGGAMTGDDVLTGLNMALDAAGFEEFSFDQDENGILNVAPDSDPTAIAGAFIPDTDEMVQAPEGTPPGLSVNDDGAFLLTTDDGFQIPLLPSPADPGAIIELLPDSEIQIGEEGETIITEPGTGDGPIVGVFDPLLTESEQEPGLYRSGEGADESILIVYPDGSAQMMMPAIQSPDEFEQAALNIPGLEEVNINTDGTIEVTFDGEQLMLQPLFDIEPGTGNGDEAPMLMSEDGTFFFVNSNGDRQEFLVNT